MKKYPVFYPALFMAICWLFFAQCKKNKNTPECAVPAVVPYQPYSDPVWHPNGQLLGFNHTPQTGVYAQGTPPCTWYMNFVNQDSTGFYLMNKDGTGFRRVTSFHLGSPSWSPDGHWIAFSEGPAIYKMHFDGYTFDTTHIVQLTDSGANYFPCWTANSDTIYFDSNLGTNGQGYYVWKMAADGSGQQGIPNTGREPYVGSNNKIYYMGLHDEVFSMNKDGSDKIQLTFNGNINNTSSNKSLPKYFNGNIYYQQIGIWLFINGSPMQLNSACETYDISINGEIVYSKWDYSVSTSDKQRGCLWIMNADGSNNRQLTFNNN